VPHGYHDYYNGVEDDTNYNEQPRVPTYNTPAPHNIHNPSSSYGSIKELHNYADDENEGFGPGFTNNFFESANLNKGFFDEHFPANKDNVEHSNVAPGYQGKRQTNNQNNLDNYDYDDYDNYDIKSETVNIVNQKPFNSNLTPNQANLNQIRNNRHFNNRYLQNQNQNQNKFQPNQGNVNNNFNNANDGIPYQYQAPGRSPAFFNQNNQRPKPGQIQGGQLNRGPLLTDLVYRNGPNRPNRQNFKNPGINLINTRQNHLSQSHRNRPLINPPNRGQNLLNTGHLGRNPANFYNPVQALGRPVRLGGISPPRLIKKDSGGFLGLGKIKLRL